MSSQIPRAVLTIKTPPPELPDIDETEEAAPIMVAPQKTRESKRVYMVFGEGGDIPRVMHRNRGIAQREAMRLALMHRDVRFHVLVSWRCYATAEA